MPKEVDVRRSAVGWRAGRHHLFICIGGSPAHGTATPFSWYPTLKVHHEELLVWC